MTNYRIIFKGTPIDPFAAEHTVIRYFPISSLTREKRFTLNEYLSEIEQQLKEGIQIRSNTFQLIRAAFDDEVSYVPKCYWVIERELQKKLLHIRFLFIKRARAKQIWLFGLTLDFEPGNIKKDTI